MYRNCGFESDEIVGRNVNWMFWTEIKYNLVNSYFVCVAEVLLQQNGNGGNVQTLPHYHIQKHIIKPTHICKLKCWAVDLPWDLIILKCDVISHLGFIWPLINYAVRDMCVFVKKQGLDSGSEEWLRPGSYNIK